MVTHLSADTFDDTINAAEGLVVLDFFADWCGPCKMFAPTFEKVAGEVSNVGFYKVDVDAEQSLASRFGIRSIPTILFMKDGEIVDTQYGMLPEPMFRKLVADLS